MTNEESLKQLVKTYYKGICTFSEATNRALQLGCSEDVISNFQSLKITI